VIQVGNGGFSVPLFGSLFSSVHYMGSSSLTHIEDQTKVHIVSP
jgi:hypothetical protein